MKYKEVKKASWKERIFLFATGIMLPCLMTLLISGTSQQIGEIVSDVKIELEDGSLMDMEEFLFYMVAGQIDLNFNEETVKAQTVIARTNLKRELKGEKQKRAEELNLVYLTPEKFENSFGEGKKQEIRKKLNQIIRETNSHVLTYEEEYIEALYHCVSIGTTVSGEEIFSNGRPYLIEVDSSQDVEAEQYMTLSVWTGKELLAKLQGIGIGKGETTDTIFTALRLGEKTKNGYVKKVMIGEESMTGEEWKNLFGLNSNYFYLEEQDGQLRMIVLGKGHGVGLSQYGANCMAEEGFNWREILYHYYPGAVLEKDV